VTPPLTPHDPIGETARKLLEVRAERLRRKPPEEEEEIFWMAEFSLGGEAYAFPLESLLACQPLKLVTPVPLSASPIAGIVRFQRRILSVMNLAVLLGTSGWHRDPSILLVLKLDEDRMVAVDCEEIPRASNIPMGTAVEARETGLLSNFHTIQRPGLSPLRLVEISNLFTDSIGAGVYGG
jgi:chemotaxis signal transduction protein